MMWFISPRRTRCISGLAFMLVCPCIMGQAVITEADMPTPGLEWTAHELTDMPPIASGPNVTWDFSGVVITNTRQLQIGEPSTAPGASNFPSATAVAFADDVPPYTFIEVTGNEMRTLGIMTDNLLIYSDPLTTMVLTCTYGTTWTDTYANPEAQGERTYAADGYGTLVGPAGSFNDVLKVHTEYTSLDTILNGAHYEGLVVEDYFWRNGIGWPLVTSLRSIVYADGQPIQETWGGSALALFFTDVRELSDADPARVWPNPTTGRITLSFKDPLQPVCHYSVYDATGQLLYQRPLPAGKGTEEVDLSRYGKGTYVIKFMDKERVCYERVVLE